ncbi:MAG TPA: TorF family putative porin [Hydrogenophaga sp.]|uniref:TorF family putative porin n=1 Tax=Hydrogenophaga sp. TaxID=1904254 RepID=UPI002B83DC14|nr:TorF family putative porin [Hydrogenophaga sp.]HMN92523.1 TorF family putative porin [Hydrogenophaga sp.]HMP10439.1 TorF family putative porin [Hydrogenophaga sp.]
MKKSTLSLALAAALGMAVLSPAHAEGLSFNVGVVSLYKSNGIDQDNRAPKNFLPALQGGVDYAFSNGFYVGNWNSTGKFGDANVEIDLYAGFSNEFGNGLSYDVGYAYYVYPDSGGGWNGSEVYGSLTAGIATVKLTRGTSGSIKKHSRLSLALAQPLTDKLTLDAVVGVRNKSNGNSGAYDYGLGVSYDLGNDLGASAMLSGAQKSKAGDAGKARLVLGLSKSF